MELVARRPNVELRARPDGRADRRARLPLRRAASSHAVRAIPHRRFDWDAREWWAPADDWVGVHVADVLARFPELTSQRRGRRLAGRRSSAAGSAASRPLRHDGRGWLRAATRAPGRCPRRCARAPCSARRRAARPADARPARDALREQRSARLDGRARRCLPSLLELGDEPPPARLDCVSRDVDGERLRLDVLWDPDAGDAFDRAARRRRAGARCRSTRGSSSRSTRSSRCTASRSTAPARPVLERPARRARRGAATPSGARGRPTAEPIAEVAAVLGGELAAVPVGGRALRARGAARVPGRRAGARQDGRGARRAGGRRRLPGGRRLPRVAEAQLGARGGALAAAPRASPSSRAASPSRRAGEITILNYEIVAAHREALARRRPRALVVDESHYVRTRRPSARRPCAGWRAAVAPDGLRLGADRHARAQPRRGARRPAAGARPARRLRLRRALRAREFRGAAARRSGCTGTCAGAASCAA